MPEFRQNLATKEWVIVSPERAKRPSDFKKENGEKEPVPPYVEDCPFCPGNEDQTPPDIYRYPREGNWQVRVVPNKYAALQSNLATTRTNVGTFLAAKGFGIAEVVIESPKHDMHPALMSIEEVIQILKAYRERHEEISKIGDINLDEDNTFANALFSYSPGETINLDILRMDQVVKLQVTLGESKQR